MRRVVGLETRTAIALTPGPELTVRADPDQLEQLLINLLRNAVDAALETGGGVSVGWTRRADQLEVCIQDEGPGLSNTSNLFVPFFTTKPTGSGIGLVLSRQIAEAHGGSLTLENRKDRAGCEALPAFALAIMGRCLFRAPEASGFIQQTPCHKILQVFPRRGKRRKRGSSNGIGMVSRRRLLKALTLAVRMWP